jgi:excisionase family DNA binding protein
MIKNNKKYLTVAEIAEMVGVTADHIRHSIVKKRIKSIRYAHRIWIEEKYVHKFERQRFPRNKKD